MRAGCVAPGPYYGGAYPYYGYPYASAYVSPSIFVITKPVMPSLS